MGIDEGVRHSRPLRGLEERAQRPVGHGRRQMVKKTIIKRQKLWPPASAWLQAIHLLNTDAGEGIVDEQRKQPGSQIRHSTLWPALELVEQARPAQSWTTYSPPMGHWPQRPRTPVAGALTQGRLQKSARWDIDNITDVEPKSQPMSEPIFRASSLGRLMTEPRTKVRGALSQGPRPTSEACQTKSSGSSLSLAQGKPKGHPRRTDPSPWSAACIA